MTTLKTKIKASPVNLLALVCIFLTLIAGFFLYLKWDGMIFTIVDTQKNLHRMLADHIAMIQSNPMEAGVSLILLSFVYGVFHAVGPGHGKAIIVTYLGTHKESIWKSTIISMCSAVLQSMVAVLIVVLIAFVLSLKLSDAQNVGVDITFVSYLLVIALGLLIFSTAITRLIKTFVSNRQALKFTFAQDPAHNLTRRNSHQYSLTHSHTDCGCKHSYTAPNDQQFIKSILVIFSMGLRPCSGALVVLIYAHLVGVFSYGIAATLMMGLGTGISVSLIAVGTVYIRSWFERLVASSNHRHTISRLPIDQIIRLLAGVFLIGLGGSLIQVALMTSQSHPFM